MENNVTFAIIKPDAIKNNHTGLIIDHILKSNFEILSAKLIKLTLKQATVLMKVINVLGLVVILIANN